MDDRIENRFPPEVPSEHIGKKIWLEFLDTPYFELENEPVFLSLALYDGEEKRKISETFHFDLNSPSKREMMKSHVKSIDISTQSRECLLEISHPKQDIHLVIRLEKVLQVETEDTLRDNKVSVSKTRGRAYRILIPLSEKKNMKNFTCVEVF